MSLNFYLCPLVLLKKMFKVPYVQQAMPLAAVYLNQSN